MYYILWTGQTGTQFWRGPYASERDAWEHSPLVANLVTPLLIVQEVRRVDGTAKRDYWAEGQYTDERGHPIRRDGTRVDTDSSPGQHGLR